MKVDSKKSAEELPKFPNILEFPIRWNKDFLKVAKNIEEWRRVVAEKLQKDLEQYKKDRKRCLESEPKEQFIACQLEGKIIVAEEVLEALKP